jgi:hypothetical protein
MFLGATDGGKEGIKEMPGAPGVERPDQVGNGCPEGFQRWFSE